MADLSIIRVKVLREGTLLFVMVTTVMDSIILIGVGVDVGTDISM